MIEIISLAVLLLSQLSQTDSTGTNSALCDCPDSAVVIGEAFPDSTAQYCALIGSSGAQVLHGSWRIWFDSGQIMEEGAFENGLEDGEWSYWNANGNRRATGRFVNGQREGVWKEWWENGNPSFEGGWKNGILHGKITTWHKNGVKSSEGMRENGKMVGEWGFWDEEGLRTSGLPLR